LLGDEAAASEVIDERLVDRRAIELEVGEFFERGLLKSLSAIRAVEELDGHIAIETVEARSIEERSIAVCHVFLAVTLFDVSV